MSVKQQLEKAQHLIQNVINCEVENPDISNHYDCRADIEDAEKILNNILLDLIIDTDNITLTKTKEVA
jgi:hypothetical protein